MRFDDSLKTVLAADATTAYGARASFRQLVDLVARGRVAPDAVIIGRLRELRGAVPPDLRASVAKAVSHGPAPAALVALFADDEPAVAAAMLRNIQLGAEDWIDLLPGLGPAGRAVLRSRRDLADEVVRALAAFGSTDFTLGYDAPRVPARPVDFPAAPPVGQGSFSAVGTVAEALPFVVEARRRAAPPTPTETGGFQVADLADRIAAFQRERETERPAPSPDQNAPAFRFETDADGVIRWIDTAPRNAVVGVSLVVGAIAGGSGADGVAAGAFTRRTSFADARLAIGGASPLAGEWRISGVPVFDHASGRFTGFRGAARRPRIDESAARSTRANPASDGLRRLVHELRTPTTAIAGFSELIESQLLGPVEPAYRDRATTIRGHAADLVAAIEDLDMAARIDGDALELSPGDVMLMPMLRRTLADLAPLVRLRGNLVAIDADDEDIAVDCDDRALERLLARLAATLISAARPDERIAIAVTRETSEMIGITFTRPVALAAIPDSDLFSLDAEREADAPGTPLLGTGFALRLARNLAAELGGSLVIGARCLTLRLPAASVGDMGQASTN